MKNTVNVTFVTRPELLAELDKYVESEQLNRSIVIRKAITEYMASRF